MRRSNSPLSPEAWMADLFSSKAACQGAVIRRKLRDIERYAGMDKFRQEPRRRGYRACEKAGQMIIFCNQEPVKFVETPFSLKENEPEFFKNSGRPGRDP